MYIKKHYIIYNMHVLSSRLDHGRHESHLTHILLNVCGALMLYICLVIASYKLRLLHTMNVRFSLLDIAQRILGVTLPNFQ
jgi:hypothetical protein